MRTLLVKRSIIKTNQYVDLNFWIKASILFVGPRSGSEKIGGLGSGQKSSCTALMLSEAIITLTCSVPGK
jgi:hypothetical protein